MENEKGKVKREEFYHELVPSERTRTEKFHTEGVRFYVIMSTIFALCGKIGSGKSYIANEIDKHYKSIIFSVDKMMLKLFGEIDGRELFIKKLNICKEIIYEISDTILEKTNGNIIFDFGFWTKADRKHLRERFNKYNVIFIYIKTDDNMCWERAEKRNKENDPNNYLFDKETFDYLAKLFEDFSEDEKFIIYENIDKLKIEIDKNWNK